MLFCYSVARTSAPSYSSRTQASSVVSSLGFPLRTACKTVSLSAFCPLHPLQSSAAHEPPGCQTRWALCHMGETCIFLFPLQQCTTQCIKLSLALARVWRHYDYEYEFGLSIVNRIVGSIRYQYYQLEVIRTFYQQSQLEVRVVTSVRSQKLDMIFHNN